MENQSSIIKNQEKEKQKELINFYPENANKSLQNNSLSNNILIYNSPNNNISPKLSQIPSKAQIYHYEKTIHDLSLQNTSLTNRIEKLLLQLDKSNALIDSHKTENDILKSQLVNQTNNNKILEKKILEGILFFGDNFEYMILLGWIIFCTKVLLFLEGEFCLFSGTFSFS